MGSGKWLALHHFIPVKYYFPTYFVGRHLPHLQAEWVGVAHCLPGHVQCHHKVWTSHRVDCLYLYNLFSLISLPPRMVESELFPALRYFGLRFYAYNPVSVQPYPGSVLGCSPETGDHHFSTCLLSQSIASFPDLQFLIGCIL